MKRQNVGVGEMSRDLYLAQEPLGAQRGCEIGTQNFYGDLAMMLDVFGKVDGCHTAAAELRFNRVSVGEGGFQAVEEVGHLSAISHQH